MKIGQVIRKRRRAMGQTLEALAAHAGTDAANLSRVERGLQNYTPDGIAALAEALQTTVATLIAEAEASNTANFGGEFRPMNDELELLMDYRRLRGSARSVVKLMVAEMARGSPPTNNIHA